MFVGFGISWTTVGMANRKEGNPIVLYEFGKVQHIQTCLNHCSTQGTWPLGDFPITRENAD